MRYYLDCEFWGFNDPNIISMALVPERYDSSELYIAFDQRELEAEARIVTLEEDRRWVRDNVLPIIDAPGTNPWRSGLCRADVPLLWPKWLESYFNAFYGAPHIIADWPDDIAYLSRLLLTGPGTMINVPGITFEVRRVDAYPTTLPGAVQHNALWDARALRHKLIGA